MKLRIITHISIIAFCIFIIFEEIIFHLNDYIFLLVFSPYLIINLLDAFFIYKALKNKPIFTDYRVSSVIICYLVTLHVVFIKFSSMNQTAVPMVQQFGCVLNFVVGFFIIWALLHLKSNLTLLPEANTIIKTGPYKHIRHPLYFAYIMLSVGEVLIYQSLMVLILSLIQFTLILIRAKREEDILINIPGYQEHQQDTSWFD